METFFMIELNDDMRRTVKVGVEAGLADAEAGRGSELTDAYIEELKQEILATTANSRPLKTPA